MDWERQCIRFCAAMLALAIVLRLGALGLLPALGQTLEQPALAAFLVYLQTGRVIHPPEPTQPVQPESTEPIPAAQPVTFTPEDLTRIGVFYRSSYRPDLEALLTSPLPFDLSGQEPAVLILHTHTTESYTPVPGEEYQASSEFRTLDPEHNMLRIGQQVAECLEQAGIRVLHDCQLHDYPSYNGSYNHAADRIQALLEQYPSIRLILDLHRDAADTAAGQMTTQASVDGVHSAQLMLVVGTGSGGLSHPDWEQNCALALKLQAVLERENPGICRDLVLSESRYNQHLSPGALLIEVGAAGNTLEEALTAAGALAQGIVSLFQTE